MNAGKIRGRFVLAFIAVLGLLFAASCSDTGTTDFPDDPAKSLVAKSVKALGGEKKMTGWRTRTEKGLLMSNWQGWGELRADCTQLIKKPDKMKLDQDFSAYDHPFFFTYYHNAGDVWVMVNLGVRQHPRYTERLTKRMKEVDGIAHYFATCDTFFMATDVEDDSLLAAELFDRVGVVDNGDTVLFDLDKKTHYPLRRVEAGGTTQVLLDDYRKTSGIKMPYHVTVYENGAKTAEYTWDEITFDAEIDDAVFEEHRPENTEEPE
jgi:hypothetical protein